ncbi:MAG: glycosyltransferase [Gemmatimonadetes bacterium]|nr:glycosyltransferase [Gemmatimonadota bacterium]
MDSESPGTAPRLAVLIPALNEEEALPPLLARLPRPPVDRVVVVDNGSTDATARVARDAGADVVSQPERGYGAACLAGIGHLAGAERRPEALVFLDADDDEAAARVGELAAPVLEGRADLVIGVRRGRGGGTGTLMPHARLGNRLVLGLAALLFGRRWRDLGPFRAVRFDRLLELEMDDRTWGWTLQMQIRAARQGLRVMEVEVPHRARSRGRSKITGSLPTSLRVGARMLWTLARERLRK